MAAMRGSLKMNAICLLGLATTSRNRRGRSREWRPPVQRVSHYLSYHAHHVDSKLTTSSHTDNRLEMRRCPTPSPKSDVWRAKLTAANCRLSPQRLVGEGSASDMKLKSSTSHPFRLPKAAFSIPILSSNLPTPPCSLNCRSLSSVKWCRTDSMLIAK